MAYKNKKANKKHVKQLHAQLRSKKAARKKYGKYSADDQALLDKYRKATGNG